MTGRRGVARAPAPGLPSHTVAAKKTSARERSAARRHEPGDPNYALPNDKRGRKVLSLTVAPETIDALDALAAERGLSRGAVVDQLVREAGRG